MLSLMRIELPLSMCAVDVRCDRALFSNTLTYIIILTFLSLFDNTIKQKILQVSKKG